MQTKKSTKLFKITDDSGFEVFVVAATAQEAAEFRQTQIEEHSDRWIVEVGFVSHNIYLAPDSCVS